MRETIGLPCKFNETDALSSSGCDAGDDMDAWDNRVRALRELNLCLMASNQTVMRTLKSGKLRHITSHVDQYSRRDTQTNRSQRGSGQKSG